PDRWRVEHLLGEVRKVSRDAFVSWDGSRYGVPWQWAGSQVVVKDRGGYVEIWTAHGDRCIYRHPKSLVKGADRAHPSVSPASSSRASVGLVPGGLGAFAAGASR
ncbi:MAG TPA: hypothetical protein VIL07_01780, partial [Symbiobacteriaceae bacterium]